MYGRFWPLEARGDYYHLYPEKNNQIIGEVAYYCAKKNYTCALNYLNRLEPNFLIILLQACMYNFIGDSNNAQEKIYFAFELQIIAIKYNPKNSQQT